MITVFGSINMDLIATTTRLPKPGETVAGNGFATAAGGKGANQALAARRAGAEVRMAGAVGRDTFAEPAVALLRGAGTDLSLIKEVDGPTGTALILVGGDGENMIAVVPGANGTVTEADADKALGAMKAGDTLMLQLEVPGPAVEHALLAARTKGVTTIINIAPLIDDAPRLGRLADIVIANETEFERLAGQDAMTPADRESALMHLHGQTGQTLIVTLGADGVVAIRENQVLYARGLAIEPVDTVGAGDTFCGYFAASIDQGMEFAAALRRAAVAGSIACLKPGAQPSIPLSDDVAKRL
ncbi:ribokinase [Rhizobiaceae bacterium n13]|uniref:Ribokinase n=1 Tax=Ferirhizobium litorale TaxID=2927786 RepID=A0AAE3QG77_9HYPH|nr:ribokinase [Fererhizobium litorale]MDI7862178.1 ribokinase [Fererhizobium litorale]MDI7922548.1 ribokinase [Fererhizobium litorale]